jgi:glycosyltransferase domain-containing protein
MRDVIADMRAQTEPISDDPLSRVTIMVHTANRPDQLYRLLRFYAAVPGVEACTILIADSSDADNIARFDALMRSAPFHLNYVMARFSAGISFPDRLRRACSTVTTDYVMLAADDDFYFLDWVRSAVGDLDLRRDTTAIIGNYLIFGLNRFTAFSDTVSIADGAPERFAIPWLEGDTAEARIGELGANPHGIQTIAWYALHRTQTLMHILDHGADYDLPLLLFERFFTMAQAASGKTHFSPDIFLARQADANPADRSWRAEPMGLTAQQHGVAKLEACACAFLSEVLGYDLARSAAMVATAYANEIRMMRQADGRRQLRRIVNRLGVRRWLDAFRQATPPQNRDPRLPQRCDPQELHRRGEQVRLACRPELSERSVASTSPR